MPLVPLRPLWQHEQHGQERQQLRRSGRRSSRPKGIMARASMLLALTPPFLLLLLLVAWPARALVVEQPCCANNLHVPAAFGPDLLSHGPLEGRELVVVEPPDGCGELSPSLDLRGKVALVKRGTCNFTDKCLRAQEKGAAAVVVYDSQDRERWGTIMSGIESRASLVTIPAVFVSHATGLALRDAALGTVGGARVTLDDTGHVRPRAKQIGPVETLATYVVVSLVLLSFSGCCGLLLALSVTCYQRAFRQRAMRGLKELVFVNRRRRKRRGGAGSGGQPQEQQQEEEKPPLPSTASGGSSGGGGGDACSSSSSSSSSLLSATWGALGSWWLLLLRRSGGMSGGKGGGRGGQRQKTAGGGGGSSGGTAKEQAAAASGPTSLSSSGGAKEEEQEEEEEEEEEETLCPICLDTYEDGDRLRVLPCGHRYHDACIRPWLLEKSEACPKCRQPAFRSPLSAATGGHTAGAAAPVGGGGGGGGTTMLRRFVGGVLRAMAGTEQEEEEEEEQQQQQQQQEGGGRPVVPLDAAAVDELCIWILSNMSGIAVVLVAVITSACLLGAVAILTPRD